MSSDLNLSIVYSNDGVRGFGRALRFALRDDKSPDFASLVELEYVETKADFADVIKKFLRRYETKAMQYDRQHEREGKRAFRPNQTHLESLMALVDKVDVRPVRAALIAQALVYNPKKEDTEREGGNDNEQ